jgi:CBS domain-containing protein
METVLDLLHVKSLSGIVAVSPEATVWEATALMNDQGIGSVLVVRGRRLAGIFTERDVLRRVDGESRDPDETAVGDVMTADVICCGQEMPIDEVAGLMRSHRVRHLPVLDAGGDVIGLVSIGDVNAHRFACCETALHQVEDYINRRA